MRHDLPRLQYDFSRRHGLSRMRHELPRLQYDFSRQRHGLPRCPLDCNNNVCRSAKMSFRICTMTVVHKLFSNYMYKLTFCQKDATKEGRYSQGGDQGSQEAADYPFSTDYRDVRARARLRRSQSSLSRSLRWRWRWPNPTRERRKVQSC